MTTLIEKSELKRKMLIACIDKQQSLLEDFKKRMKALLEPEGLGNEEKFDNVTQARASQRITELNTLNEAVSFANQEMRILQLLRDHGDREFDRAALGAVVRTDSKIFFVSVSIEEFEVDGNAYFGLSTLSPLFQSMKGKKAGEEFGYHDRMFKILDIF